MTLSHRLLALAAFALLLLPALGASEAQAQGAAAAPRIGFTDYELIIVQMPRYREIQQELQRQAEADRGELAQLEQDIQSKFADYQSNQGILSQEARQQREEEILGLQQNLQEEQQRRLQELGRMEAELLQPLFDELQQAIDAVAQEQNLSIVLSTRVANEPVLLYAGPNAVDVTPEVMSRLGISMTTSRDGAASGN